MQGGLFVDRRDAHETGDLQPHLPAIGDERIGLGRHHAGLLGFFAGVHLHDRASGNGPARLSAGRRCARASGGRRVSIASNSSIAWRALLVCKRADQVQLDARESLAQLRPLAGGLLHLVLAEQPVALVRAPRRPARPAAPSRPRQGGSIPGARPTRASSVRMRSRISASGMVVLPCLETGKDHSPPQKKRAGRSPLFPVPNPEWDQKDIDTPSFRERNVGVVVVDVGRVNRHAAAEVVGGVDTVVEVAVGHDGRCRRLRRRRQRVGVHRVGGRSFQGPLADVVAVLGFDGTREAVHRGRCADP